jgi:hypothetical protein
MNYSKNGLELYTPLTNHKHLIAVHLIAVHLITIQLVALRNLHAEASPPEPLFFTIGCLASPNVNNPQNPQTTFK